MALVALWGARRSDSRDQLKARMAEKRAIDAALFYVKWIRWWSRGIKQK